MGKCCEVQKEGGKKMNMGKRCGIQREREREGEGRKEMTDEFCLREG